MSFGERFLVHPDLFPARTAGEPWGDDELIVDLVGGPYAFRGLATPQSTFLRQRYAGFARPLGEPGSPPAVRCDVFQVTAEEFIPIDLRGFELTLDRDCSAAAVRLAGVDLQARLEWRRGALAAGLWTSNGDPAYFHGALENLFRVLVAYRMLELGGALIHSAGIAPSLDPGSPAVVCYGTSGAGKSTLSRLALAAGQHVLSDDLNAVLPSSPPGTPPSSAGGSGDGSARFAPVPFAGDHRPRSWDPTLRPLAALCRLVQGTEESLHPAVGAAVLAGLVACAPYVNADPHRCDPLLANLDRLLHSTPAYRLTFALDGRASGLLEQAAQ